METHNCSLSDTTLISVVAVVDVMVRVHSVSRERVKRERERERAYRSFSCDWNRVSTRGTTCNENYLKRKRESIVVHV